MQEQQSQAEYAETKSQNMSFLHLRGGYFPILTKSMTQKKLVPEKWSSPLLGARHVHHMQARYQLTAIHRACFEY